MGKPLARKKGKSVRKDALDKALALALKDRQDMPIKFKKESYGVYNFGTKRVSVRLDKDRLNVRVGGGSITLEKFLETYTKTEIMRTERRDSVLNFTKSRIESPLSKTTRSLNFKSLF